MRRSFRVLMLCCSLVVSGCASASDGKVIKVLPQLLDLQGHHTLSPSLYERDAYQAFLRQHTNEISGMRFAIEWKAPRTAEALKLRVELRGTAKGDLPSKAVLEQPVEGGGWFSHWTSLPLTGETWRNLGSVTAWRATLWKGDRLVGEEKSFLW